MNYFDELVATARDKAGQSRFAAVVIVIVDALNNKSASNSRFDVRQAHLKYWTDGAIKSEVQRLSRN